MARAQRLNVDKYCYQGHVLKHRNTSSSKANYRVCIKCRKDIIIAKGYYHCSVDQEDYHVQCVSRFKEKETKKNKMQQGIYSKLGAKIFDGFE